MLGQGGSLQRVAGRFGGEEEAQVAAESFPSHLRGCFVNPADQGGKLAGFFSQHFEVGRDLVQSGDDGRKLLRTADSPQLQPGQLQVGAASRLSSAAQLDSLVKALFRARGVRSYQPEA